MLMDLYIETLTGVSFELRVSPTETVMSIKSKIQRAEGIPITQQHLIWQNGELDDHRRLRDYSISGGSTIRLVLGLCGGPLNTHRLAPLRLAPLHIPASSSSILSRLRRNSSSTGESNQLPVTSSSHALKLPEPCSEASRLSHSSVPVNSKDSPLKPHDQKNTSDTPIVHPSVSDFAKSNTRDVCLNSMSPTAPTADRCYSPKASRYSSRTIVDENAFPDQAVNDVASTARTSRAETLSAAHVQLKTDTENSNNDSKATNEEASDTLVTTHPASSNGLPTTLEYPPLFQDGSSRYFANCHDLSSFWRVYEPQTLSSLSRAFLVRNSYQLVGASDRDDDSTPPGSAGDDESRLLDKRSPSKTTELDDDTSNYPFGGPSSSTSATTLLAGLLSTSGDQLDIPCQTSGGEHFFNNDNYCDGSQRTPSSFLDDLEFARRNRLAALLWNSDDFLPSQFTSSSLDLDADRDDEDNQDADGHGSIATKGGFDFEVDDEDDDDSLTDWEDYMMYYRTGDLLFGPPSLAALYPSYSCYTFYDQYPYPELETDFGLYSTQSTKEESREPQLNSSWQEEREKMAEKVNELKRKMKELRIRRQRARNPEQQQQAQSKSGTTDIEPSPQNGSPKALPGVYSSSMDPLPAQDPRGQTPPTSDPVLHAHLSDPELEQKQRRRRFGTVIPPERDSLIHPSSTTRLSESSEFCHASAPSLLAPIPSTRLRRPVTTMNRSSLNTVTSPLNRLSSTRLRPATVSKTDHRPLVDWPSALLELSPAGKPDRPRTSGVIGAGKETAKQWRTKGRTPLPALVPSVNLQRTNARCSKPDDARPTTLPPIVTNEPCPGVTRSPTKSPRSPPSFAKRKRCALCLRKIGIVNSYYCRCGRNYCSRHRYAETHSCSYDYKAEGRRALLEANPVVTAPKLPKI